jgi:pimeloyl-ACP methyl ester carboxylesterase
MQKVVSRDGTTIAYDKVGDGPPIVLLGGGFRDHTAFAPLVPVLAPHLTTYSYDRRGRGESGDAATYAIEREVEDLAAVIAETGGGAAVFGGSSGGILALETALAGVEIRKLAVLEPPYRLPGYPRPPAEFAPRLAALLGDERREEAVEYFLRDMSGFSDEQVDDWRQGPMWPANLAMAHTLPYDTALLDLGFSAERLSAVAADALVISSDTTSPWLLAAAGATAAALPHSRHVTLAGLWHRVPPEVLGPALVEFVGS